MSESFQQVRQRRRENGISKKDTEEWVILLSGSAGLLFEDEDEVFIMNAGDYIHIEPHQRHRVEWTDPEQKTVWLALHFT